MRRKLREADEHTHRHVGLEIGFISYQPKKTHGKGVKPKETILKMIIPEFLYIPLETSLLLLLEGNGLVVLGFFGYNLEGIENIVVWLWLHIFLHYFENQANFFGSWSIVQSRK